MKYQLASAAFVLAACMTHTLHAEEALAPPVPTDKCELLGVEAETKSIAYIVQHSGAMLDKWDRARSAVIRSIRQLTSLQTVTVVTVNDQTDLLATGSATKARKKVLINDLQKKLAQGQLSGNDAPWKEAFKKAAEKKPEIVYLLLAGDISDAAVTTVEQTARDAKMRVFIIALDLTGPVENADAEQLRLQAVARLERFARNTGGAFTVLADKDLDAYLHRPEPPEPADLPEPKAASTTGELFPDITPTDRRSTPVVKPAPPPPPRPTSPPVAAPTVAKPATPAAPSFQPTHRITLTSGRVINGIPVQDGEKTTIKMELGSISVKAKDIKEIQALPR